MADNVTLNAGSGGDTVAADDIGGAKYQRVKLAVGDDGSAADVKSGGGTEAGSLRVTIASDSTGVLSVDDNGGNLSIDDGGNSITVDGTVAATQSGTWTVTGAGGSFPVTDSGGSLTVDGTVAATQSGTWNVGTVTTVSSISAVIPGTSATNLGKAEDAAHADGDTGVMALAVRRDADTALAGTTGDYAPLQVNSAGSLKVAITSGAGSGGTSIADAATYTRGSTSVTPVAGVVETSAPSLSAGNAGALSLTTGGALRVNVASGAISGVTEDAVASGSAEGVLAVVVRDDALSTLTPADGDYTSGRTNARGALWVALDSTAAQTVTLAAGTATNEVVGDVAHDAAAAGNPLLMGAYASAAAPTDVSADADAVRLWALRSGALAVQPSYSGILSVAGNGASGTGVQRVTIANDSTGVLATVTNVATIGTSVTPGTSAAHLGKAEDAAHSSGDTGVMALAVRADTLASTAANGDYVPALTDSVGALWTRDSGEIADDAAFTPGTSRVIPIGLTADETATDSVDEGDVGAARMTLDRKAIVTQYVHAAAGGHTPYKNLDVDESEDDIKTSAGKLFWIHVMNLSNGVRYLKIYNNVAASVTVGSTVPDLTFPIPTMADTNGCGFCLHFGDAGMQFSTGICIAATTGLADNNSGAPGANEVVLNAGYL